MSASVAVAGDRWREAEGRARRGRGPARVPVLLAAVLVVSLAGPSRSEAARHTPDRWRATVETHPDTVFVGQRKHVGWFRDQDSNFIDDEIERRFGRGDSVDVVIELNRCASSQDIVGVLSEFGRVTYVGRLVSCAYMKDVRFEDLRRLAALPMVAMVEWQGPMRSASGVATRAVQAVESASYGTGNAARTSADKSLDGSGVVIAVFDCGVINGSASLPYSGSTDAESFAGGFDATVFEDVVEINGVDDSYEDKSTCGTECIDEPGDGTTDPAPTDKGGGEHATEVAFLALGRSTADSGYRTGSDESTGEECEGVAPGARLIDVKVCEDKSICDLDDTADGDVMQGIDWLARYHETVPVGVANFSIYDASPCDGTCALCEAVNYLAFLGIVPVVCMGNATCTGPSDCDEFGIEVGANLVSSPAAATYAITVQASDDGASVKRDDDTLYDAYLMGPRPMPEGFTEDPLGRKPDISAPGVSVRTLGLVGTFVTVDGTSFAAPLVAGAAALLRQRMPTASPAVVKDLLLRTADSDGLTGPSIPERYGAGLLNVFAALNAEKIADVAFPSCDPAREPAEPGSPCPLEAGLNDWINYRDIEFTGTLAMGSEIEFQVHVENRGSNDAADVNVSLAFHPLGAGSNSFEEIGTKTVSLADGGTETLRYPWTVPGDGGYCVQATIHYGLDSNPGNNVTRRNIFSGASRFDVLVENPFMVPARFRVAAVSERANWTCSPRETTFTIGGMEDCGKLLRVSFRAPAEARTHDRATCNVSVFARTTAMRQEALIGGVTLVTYVPRDCQVSGRVVDEAGRPIPGARLLFTRDLPAGLVHGEWERDRTASSDYEGRFSTAIVPDAHQTIRVTLPGRAEPIVTDYHSSCDGRTLSVIVGKRGIRLAR